MTNEQALSYMHNLLRGMLDKKASDLFISADFPPAMKIDGKMTPVTQQKLTGEFTKAFAEELMSEKQRKEFAEEKECNFAIYTTKIPNFNDLGLPEVLKEVMMTKRGLVILVGGTGSGKSTTLAALIDYRNE